MPVIFVNIDNYKTKVMRRLIRTPLDLSLSTALGKLMHVIGTSDNVIGGLFGDDDFLPDDPAGRKAQNGAGPV